MEQKNNEELSKRVIKRPGMSTDRSKALEDLFQAKTTGIRRTAQYEDERHLEEEHSEQNNKDDEDDFIEKDEYDLDEEDDEELEMSHVKKKGKKIGGTMPIYSFMKPNTNVANVHNTKKPKQMQQTKKIDENQSKDLMDSLFNDAFNNPNPSAISNNFNVSSLQHSLKPSENMAEIYKSNFEKSKDIYDISIKPLKKQEETNSTFIQPKKFQPLQNLNKIEEENPVEKLPTPIKPSPISKFPAEKEKSSHKPKLTQLTDLKPQPIIEEPIIEIETIEEPSIRGNIEMDEQNNKWNNVNENSDVLLSNAFEKSKDVNEIYDEDGNLLIYYYDAYEDNHAYPGVVFVFGKVLNKKSKNYESCCLMVKNIQRNIYLSPREDEVVDFMQMNQEIEEIKKKHFSSFSFTWVKQMKKKKYAFELPISYLERDYFLLKYGYDIPALPHNLKGRTFDFVIGSTYSALELFLLKRKIRGPQWLLIKKGDFSIAKAVKSWCPYEFVIEKKKNVHIISKEMNLLPPPLKTLAFSLKTLKQKNSKKQEIIMISCLFTEEYQLDGANRKENKSSVFSLVSKLDNKQLPPNIEAKFKSLNKNIKFLPNEYALLEIFINRINALDPDILIGHDLYSNLFEKILTRIQERRMNNWSRLGRLQKIVLPKGNSNLFKTRYATVGRLLCDTYLSARELVREADYTIDHLAKVHLNLERKVIGEEYYLSAYEDQQKLVDLIESTAYDAFLTMEIMNKLEILPLTKELTTTAGNLWIKSLQNSRAERNEMLLMHEFYQNNYLFPDKYSYQHDDRSLLENTEKTEKQGKNKKKYAGGLVLEPKSGLYDKYILLLDFNSLYPSLIQEYNICFTTVKRPSISLEEQIRQKLHKNEKKAVIHKSKNRESSENNKEENEGESDGENFESIEELITVDESNEKSILPKVIRSLVDKRRVVKNLLKKSNSEEEKQNLDIKQKALKLIANSIYGCLGFSSSRFYAKPLAALITKRGRDTLEKSVSVVRDKLGYDVIYGDTDSMMINSKCEGEQLGDALKIGFEIRKEINKLSKNKKLEIDIDGIFKPLLLLRKKKYAAKKIVNLGSLLINPNLQPKFVQELKGLDMVRRDWCDLSKKSSQTVLDIILSGGNKDEVIFEIIEATKKINERLKGNCSLKEFLLTKQLTKHPNDYAGGQNIPHVVVAKRMKENGENDGNLVGHFIHYLICKGGENKNLSERAYHPSEFKEKQQELELDIEYYKAQQVMPPLTRICKHIDGLSISALAECLELDGNKFRAFDLNDKDINDQILNNDETELEGTQGNYDKISFEVFCINCKSLQKYKGVWDKDRKNYGIYCQCTKSFKEGILLNTISKYLKEMCDKYYEGITLCQEESCGAKLRQIRMKEERCPMFCRKSKVIQILQEKRIYQNFRHLKNLFDYENYCANNKNIDLQANEETIRTFGNCKRKIQEYLDKCVINLGNLFKFYGATA